MAQTKMTNVQKAKKRIPLWLVLLIVAALGIALGLLLPVWSSPPM